MDVDAFGHHPDSSSLHLFQKLRRKNPVPASISFLVPIERREKRWREGVEEEVYFSLLLCSGEKDEEEKTSPTLGLERENVFSFITIILKEQRPLLRRNLIERHKVASQTSIEVPELAVLVPENDLERCNRPPPPPSGAEQTDLTALK